MLQKQRPSDDGADATGAHKPGKGDDQLISRRSRQRAPPLTTVDRFVLGLTMLFVSALRGAKLAVILKPATLLQFHRAASPRGRGNKIRSASSDVHPFVERLIGTVRREYLDRTFFWNSIDLDLKLKDFQNYYNCYRVHRSINGATPAVRAGIPLPSPAQFAAYAWKPHCRDLFETPVAA